MKHKLPFLLLLFQFSIFNSQFTRAQQFDARGLTFLDPETIWIETTLSKLTLEQRIAQLMVVRVPLNMNDNQYKEFSERMNGYCVGGFCFFAGTAERQAPMTRRFQQDARVPLLICIDGEWGLGMRLKDMYSFPRNAKFGQLTPDADSIVYRMGEEIGRQCREMGIHINFAPVVDINSNPKNPVIGTRSYGTDRERVSQLGIMFTLGQQSQGVIAVAKHFPGHGDTDKDSHLELPVINHTLEYMDSIDLYPFRRLIEAGVEGVMVAHLQVNAYDRERPSSLSPVIVTDLLKNKLGFDGLVITDGIDMKGVTNTYSGGKAELAALLAGNNIILLPPDVPQSIETIKHAAAHNDSLRALIDYHCRRVLRAKYHHVLPYLDEEIQVPDESHKEVCADIVADLNLNLNRRIDTIVNNAIAAGAMPGCQIVVLHKGRKMIDRTYGRVTNRAEADAVQPSTVYDLASLTKVCATTLAVMKLYEEGRVDLDGKLSSYLPYLRGTDKEGITLKQALSHCAGLIAYDNLWQQTADKDSIFLLIAQSQLRPDNSYCYSDFGFMLLADMVERVSGQPLDQYVSTHFYRPMGLRNTTFRPTYNGVSTLSIAPTEIDTLRGEIWGNVHDPNAYALGGVSGHAGLFSTAGEVAELMQMLLDGGVYHGQRYLKEETVNIFNTRYFAQQGNRRALGFDKQLFNPSKNGQACPEATQNSFGHTGFTGTMLWVDPDYDLVYVFLSNRTYPSSADNKLARMNVRTDIQSLLYQILNQ